ncbi:soluble quino protein glucose/sorbosone dehydrogenase, partial [Gorgonomyces haynaldii]
LNHGMALSRGYLYASSDTTVYRWPYVDGSRTLIQAPAEMVVHNISASGKGGAPFGHFTRTLAFSPDHMLYVSVGSLNNVDNDSYRARVRRCDPSQVPQGGFDYDQMEVWADGLRNGVAIAFDNAGRLWEADNGPDNLKRDDLSPALFEDNPSEEINLLSGPAGAFYGYPYCWTAYNIPNIPRGTQLAWPYDGNLTDVKTDDWCQNTENNRPPLGFLPPHSSPIGARFYNGSLCTKSSALGCEFSDAMFVTLHGSWNPTVPHGFQVMAVPMNGTQPGIPIEIFSARDYKNRCTGDVALNECFRPAGIAFDPLGRLWVSSDSTGDVVMI